MEITARSLVLDLIATAASGAMPVGALVEAGALFGFEANNVRVSLSKLCTAGRVVREGPGHYKLSDQTAASAKELRGWRGLEGEIRNWRGDWVAVHCARLGRGVERRRRERALAVFGFRSLEPGLFLRPNNLRGGIDGVRDRYRAIAPETGAPALMYRIDSLEPAADGRARALWDDAAMTGRYRDLARAIERSRRRLPRLSREQALVETFSIGGEVVRHLVIDPLLPDSILDPAPRRVLLQAMREYDVLGRDLWLEFLVGHGARARWRATYGVREERQAV